MDAIFLGKIGARSLIWVQGVIMYFLSGLDVTASKFWIYMLFVYTVTICMTALYRMFAALSPTIDDAVRFSGIGLNLLIIYTGYVIPKPQLISEYIWFGWIYCRSIPGDNYIHTDKSQTLTLYHTPSKVSLRMSSATGSWNVHQSISYLRDQALNLLSKGAL